MHRRQRGSHEPMLSYGQVKRTPGLTLLLSCTSMCAMRQIGQGVLCQWSRQLPEWEETMAEGIWGLDLHCNKTSDVSSFIVIEQSRLHGHVQPQMSRLIRLFMVAWSRRRFWMYQCTES